MTALSVVTARSQPTADDGRIALARFGPPGHGIVLAGQQIADAAAASGFTGTIVSDAEPMSLEHLPKRLPARCRVVHLQVNDWLFGGPERASVLLTSVGLSLRDRGIDLVVVLHDLPQPSDGPELFARRAAAYRLFAELAGRVIVCSEHEHALLEAVAPQVMTSVAVVPLPVSRFPGAAGAPTARPPVVAVFGYLYPGKGHAELIADLPGMPPGTVIRALGRPSDRHADLVPELARLAARQGLSFECTGFVPESVVPDRLREVSVPVAPHAHISASGSINSWLAAGRRPLVPDGQYVRELADRMPGSVTIYQPGRLRDLVLHALAHPETTVSATNVVIGPDAGEVAARHLAICRAVERSRR